MIPGRSGRLFEDALRCLIRDKMTARIKLFTFSIISYPAGRDNRVFQKVEGYFIAEVIRNFPSLSPLVDLGKEGFDLLAARADFRIDLFYLLRVLLIPLIHFFSLFFLVEAYQIHDVGF